MIEEPVSNMTVITYGGVPTRISPTYCWLLIFLSEIPLSSLEGKFASLAALLAPSATPSLNLNTDSFGGSLITLAFPVVTFLAVFATGADSS